MDPHRNQHQLTFPLKRKVSKRNFKTFFSLPFFSTISYYIRFSLSCQEEICSCRRKSGDPCGNRTHVCGVRGRRLNRLTNGPHLRVAMSTPSKPNNAVSSTRQAPAIIMLRSSPRLISIGQLHALPRFHLRPINVIVYDVPYSRRMRDLILGRVSRLDAFSVYLVRT